ncbi:hypothetical protein GOY13_00845 [Wolbachia endosymbiont of Cruorifilaria tuberocauda]|uniref:hypothetical protein n=1 Tax=Wolbachia endosymbiont of Cruorifilaria tuberocauda TaxID=1812111 RepID=UPI00158D5A8E|nr:hypothetical protein [Wolbachia endosymbiont of Cruorifilaria tuberocauda]QKX01515.1 hypothetical protein GOY13_00845 [Wolbachia endosymbiont of Cruorifilaria tuberocauda]
MSNEYNQSKVKPVPDMTQETEKIENLRVQNVLLQKKYKINFDDKKYAVKIIKTQFAKTEQHPSKARDFLKSIPVIGGLLAKIFTSEKGIHKKLRLQTIRSRETKNEDHINDKHIEKVCSKLKRSNIEQVDKEEKNLGP